MFTRNTLIALSATAALTLVTSCTDPDGGLVETPLGDWEASSILGGGTPVEVPTVTFDDPVFKPQSDNARLDWCFEWGTGCGQVAADAYCQKLGFSSAADHQKAPDVGPTKLPDGTTCDQAACDGFDYIVCEGSPWSDTREDFLDETMELGSWVAHTPAFERCVDYKMRNEYKDCKYDPFYNEQDDIQAENILGTTRTTGDIGIMIDWKKTSTGSGAAAIGPYSNDDENVTIVARMLYDADILADSFHRKTSQHRWWSKVIWHENVHQHGWRDHLNPHGSSHPHTWDNVLESCGLNIRFDNPTLQGRPVDYCKYWAQSCGQEAADEYCVINGYVGASDFQVEYNVGPSKLVTGPECDFTGCDGFEYIECERTVERDGSETSFLVHEYPVGWKEWNSYHHGSHIVSNCVLETHDHAIAGELETGSVSSGEMRVFGPFSNKVSSNFSMGVARLQTVDGSSAAPNADLYIKKGSAPSLGSYHCVSNQGALAIDECPMDEDADYYIGVYGAGPADFNLSVIWERPLQQDEHQDLSISAGQYHQYNFESAGQVYVRVITKTGNADLYMRRYYDPTTANHDFASTHEGLRDDIIYIPTAGNYHFAVFAAEDSQYDIELSYVHKDGADWLPGPDEQCVKYDVAGTTILNPSVMLLPDGQVTYGMPNWWEDDVMACYQTFLNPGYLTYFPGCDLNDNGSVELQEVLDIYEFVSLYAGSGSPAFSFQCPLSYPSYLL